MKILWKLAIYIICKLLNKFVQQIRLYQTCMKFVTFNMILNIKYKIYVIFLLYYYILSFVKYFSIIYRF